MKSPMGLFKRLRSAAKLQMPLSKDELGTLAKLVPGGYKTAPYRGVQGMLKAYSRSPWIRAVESKIGDATGSAKWMLFALKGAGGKFVKNTTLQDRGINVKELALGNTSEYEGELVQITDHPALRLINSANPLFPGTVGRAQTQIQLDLTGEAHWLIGPGEGGTVMPESFWVLPSHWVKAAPSIQDPFWEVQTPVWNGKFPAEAILRFMTPDPINPYGRGSGIFRAFGDEIDTDEYAAQHVKSWFLNKARPDLLITGQGLGKKDTERMELSWLNTLRGFMKAHRPFFIGRKVEVHQLSQKFSDMELTELRRWERDIIVHGIGVPPEMLGILENSNRSTIDAADYLWAKGVITPRLELLRAFLQWQLLPIYDDRLILAYESPIAEDREYQLQVMQARPEVFKVSDWKRKAGIEPDDEDDVYLISMTTKIVSELKPEEPLTPLAPIIPPAELEPGVEEEGGQKRLEASCGCKDGHGHQSKASAASLVPQKRTGAVRKTVGGEGAVDAALQLSNQMQKDIIRSFMDLRNSLDLNALMAAFDANNIEQAMRLIDETDVAASLESARQTLKQALVVAGTHAAEEMSAFLGDAIAFTLTNPESITFLEQFGADMVTNVTEETREAVRLALTEAYRDGLTPQQAAKRIEESIGLTKQDMKLKAKLIADMQAAGATTAEIEEFIGKWTEAKIRYRAQVIALNELVEAGNAGQEMLWDEAARGGMFNPNDVQRIWIVTPDDRLCVLCSPMEGQIAGLYDPWFTPTGPVNTPNQIHVRCRCTEVLEFKS